MSVIVKGMKMPEDCRECPFEDYHSDIGQTVCMASLRVLATGFKTISFDGRHCSCPLVALPDKHGRLVDADALIEKYWNGNSMTITAWDLKDINTVIEAEGEE